MMFGLIQFSEVFYISGMNFSLSVSVEFTQVSSEKRTVRSIVGEL